jgi:hypothetical protein
LRNCGVAIADQHCFKMLRNCDAFLRCRIAIADSKKSCACPALVKKQDFRLLTPAALLYNYYVQYTCIQILYFDTPAAPLIPCLHLSCQHFAMLVSHKNFAVNAVPQIFFYSIPVSDGTADVVDVV